MLNISEKADHDLLRETELDETLSQIEYAREMRGRRWSKVRLLWEQRRFLGWATGIAFVLAVAIAFLIPRKYESTTRLMPPGQQSSTAQAILSQVSSVGGSSTAGLGGLAGELLGSHETGDLFIGVLSSRTLQDRLIDQFELKRVYWTRRYENARIKLQENTAMGQDRKSGIISITVTDHDAKRAAAIAGAYVTELDRLMSELNSSSGHRERVFLEQRLNEVKQELAIAERNFSQYANKSGAIDITEQGKAMVGAAAVLQGQYIAAQSELEGLRQIFTNNNVRVRAAEARVEELHRQLEKLSGTPAGPGNKEIGGTGDSSLYPSIRELPLLGVTYADLYRQTKIRETVFEVLTKEYELAKAQEAGEAPSVTVLDPANVSEEKSFPPRGRIIVLVTVAAFLGSIALLLLRNRWQEIDPNDPGKVLASEVAQTVRNSFGQSRVGAKLHAMVAWRGSNSPVAKTGADPGTVHPR